MTAIGELLTITLTVSVILISTFMVMRYRSLRIKAEHALREYSKRQAVAYQSVRRYQNDLRSCVQFIPAMSFVVGRKDRKFVQPSECLTNWIEALSGKPETPETLVSYLFNSEKHPDFLPILSSKLGDTSIESGTFQDTLKVPFDSSTFRAEHSIGVRIEVLEEVVCVWFETSSHQPLPQSRERSDATVIRSILNETDLPTALDNSSDLLRCQLGNGLACSVSLLDNSAKTLKLVWGKGLGSSVVELVESLPLVFGDFPSANALLTETPVTKEYNSPGARHEPPIVPESVLCWRAYPVLSNDGAPLGTVDFYLFDGFDTFPSDDSVANFLFVVAVLLERKVAISTIFRQARLDQAVKEVGQRLMIAEGGATSSTLDECLIFLTTATPLSDGNVGIIYDSGEDEAEIIGSLFENTSADGACRSGLSVLSLKAFCSDIISPKENDMTMEAMLVEKGSALATKVSAALPICSNSANASFFVSPLLLGTDRVGLMIFALPGDHIPDAAYGNIMNMVSPSIASYLSKENLLRELERRANHDQLTGLLNRGCIEERLVSEINRSNRYDNDFAVILFDIDHFKQINDQFGHDVGDEVLRQVSRRAEASIRAVDLIGRWGGEEFLIILVETDLVSARHVAENIRRLIESDVYESNKPVTISAGVACYSRGDTATTLVKRADITLYKAKQQGRNQVVTTG
ncbi:GGDEF domain-containing protein [Marinobacter sp. NSM]|uniref:GGDEF domain-containing protein n=1 Tax=Marinobacter sp. NSM TaxID=3458004 RepID=UPI00403581F6